MIHRPGPRVRPTDLVTRTGPAGIRVEVRCGGIPLRELDSLPIRHAKVDSVMAWQTHGRPDWPFEPRNALGSLIS